MLTASPPRLSLRPHSVAAASPARSTCSVLDDEFDCSSREEWEEGKYDAQLQSPQPQPQPLQSSHSLELDDDEEEERCTVPTPYLSAHKPMELQQTITHGDSPFLSPAQGGRMLKEKLSFLSPVDAVPRSQPSSHTPALDLTMRSNLVLESPADAFSRAASTALAFTSPAIDMAYSASASPSSPSDFAASPASSSSSSSSASSVLFDESLEQLDMELEVEQSAVEEVGEAVEEWAAARKIAEEEQARTVPQPAPSRSTYATPATARPVRREQPTTQQRPLFTPSPPAVQAAAPTPSQPMPTRSVEQPALSASKPAAPALPKSSSRKKASACLITTALPKITPPTLEQWQRETKGTAVPSTVKMASGLKKLKSKLAAKATSPKNASAAATPMVAVPAPARVRSARPDRFEVEESASIDRSQSQSQAIAPLVVARLTRPVLAALPLDRNASIANPWTSSSDCEAQPVASGRLKRRDPVMRHSAVATTTAAAQSVAGDENAPQPTEDRTHIASDPDRHFAARTTDPTHYSHDPLSLSHAYAQQRSLSHSHRPLPAHDVIHDNLQFFTSAYAACM